MRESFLLRSTRRLALLAAFAAFALGHAETWAQSFEELVEEALKRQRAGADAAPGEAEPLFPPPGVAPVAPMPAAPSPGAPAMKPVELGPKPYTPPAVATPPDGTAPPTQTAPSAGATAAAPDAPGVAPAEAAAPGAERTRESLQPAEVNAATFSEEVLAVGGANPLILKAQVLLDRAGASPGVIDGYAGGNFAKAVAAVETVLKLEADGELDRAVWDALKGDGAEDVLVQHTITEQDLSYPFVAAIPDDFAEQARLPSLAYSSPEEMFGERFHIDVKLLEALNPAADFGRAGTAIWVTSVSATPVSGKIATIVADKTRRQVRAYDAQNRLIVAYPATIGSADNPSPTGEHRVEAVAPNPVYYYDPANFMQGNNTEKLELPPGPNNPVGSTWIDLTEPGYGIHGTPDPTKIDKTASHGCVRLTNWDAEELAGMVEPGVVVTFVE